MLNIIWLGFFFIAFLTGLYRLFILGDMNIFNDITLATFTLSKTAFEISLGLTGVLCFWMGIMKIGEKSGFINHLTRFLNPLLKRLMPDIPDKHPALGAMVMNLSANMLGLDNAATPLGIKAMQHLQTINPLKDTASNAQILFLVINTSAVTLFPLTIFTYRAQMGAADPTDVFIPILIATYASTMAGLIAVASIQRIKLYEPVVLCYLAAFSTVIGLILFHFSSLDQASMQQQSSLASNFIIFSLIIVFMSGAIKQRINVYDAFIDGAKEGFQTAVMIIPYLVAMLVAIGVFRASGALEITLDYARSLLIHYSLDSQFLDALPTALIKPLSGSGARAMMIDTMQTHGADSFAGRLASIVQGSTETTFYVLAVYFGAVGIKKARHAVACGLFADLIGIITAICIGYVFFA
ncbi:nucleoside recognition domain-containing protein [Cycloclasticus zancles]|uniref:Transmembrane spore maturation-like protein n=1 Tax=Cycloclasticus zancles 78-ME TaxID=1198232 RepID=S5T6N8_9GAMM|nr:spore maturation protein [Cycloclasticus zancles]AGS39446.1 Transmembrane spore maturation-like protein [Cycloclasticus zancles 78-ME]